MSRYHQRGEQYKPKLRYGSVEEEYLTRKEFAAARKAIMNYKLRDPGPSFYSKRRKRNEKS